MGKSQETFSKKEKEKKRLQKRKEKQQRKEERKAKAAENEGGLDSMIAYVDENGNITDTPPDPTKKREEIDASSIEIGVPRRNDEEDDTDGKKGQVSYFDHSKGYGFIIDSISKERYFVHVSGLADDEVQEGDKVTYDLEQGMKGLNAVNVKKV